MKNTIKFQRLLTVCLAFVLVIANSNWAIYANTNADTNTNANETFVIFGNDGSIKYQSAAQDGKHLVLEDDVIVNNLDNEDFSTYQPTQENISLTSSDLEPISSFVATNAPYKYSCLISAKFPNGETHASSGILVGKMQY